MDSAAVHRLTFKIIEALASTHTAREHLLVERIEARLDLLTRAIREAATNRYPDDDTRL